MRKRCNAFTLVELLIVIIIIAVLAAVAIPKFQNSADRSKESRARADLRMIRDGMQRVFFETGLYPKTIADMALSSKPAKGKRFNGNNWLEPAMPSTWQGPYLLQQPVCPVSGYMYALRWSSAGVAEVRVSTSGDREDDNPEGGNPYFNW